MTDSLQQRLSSTHLEDLAFILLSACSARDLTDLYPALGDDMRARLRSRVKQLSRYDWPSSMNEDPLLRRGYTLRQCYRLAVTLLLLDAHLPPSLAVQLAKNNERSFLFAIAERLIDPARLPPSPNDLIAVIIPAEIQEALSFPALSHLVVDRVRLIRRTDLAELWSNDLTGPGARLMVDIGTSALALWHWLSRRRLMDDGARIALLAEINNFRGESGFERVGEKRLRR